MASCLNATGTKDVHLLEMGQAPAAAPGVTVATNSSSGAFTPNRGASTSVPLIAWRLFISAVAIAALILGAWSTAENMKEKSLSSAVLISSPSQVPKGYRVVVNMFRGTGSWSSGTPMLYYRSDHGVVADARGSVFVFGGMTNDNVTGAPVALNTLVRYDVLYNTSQELQPMLSLRTRFGWALLNNKIYVFGGVNRPDSFDALGTTEVYDITTDRWSPLGQMNTPRTDMCAGAINGKIYVAGGYAGSNSDVIEEYDPATNQWTVVKARMQIPRGDCVAVVLNNELYIMGGTVQISPPGVNCSDQWWLCYEFSKAVEVFNPATGTVRRAADMLTGRGDFGAAVYNGNRILVAGGEHADPTVGVDRLLATDAVESYNPADDWWTPKAPMAEAKFRFAMATAAGSVYAYGGHPSCPSPDNSDETRCRQAGLNSVTVFSDVEYPGAYLAVRN